MVSFEQCAYAAGFVDGEGSIYVRGPHGQVGHKASYSIAVTIGNDDIRPMMFLQGIWGGSISPGPVRSNGKCNSRWTLTAVKAATFLKDILPYLIVKREQAFLVLKLQSTKRRVGPWQPLTNDIVSEWREIKQQVATLNARYPGFYDRERS